MAKRQSQQPSPACYAIVLPGLEAIASDELEKEFGAEVKKTSRGIVVFRVDEITKDLLRLRTVEDVFVLAWGTDKLSFKAEDLKSIRRWTAQDAKWDRLLKIHHSIRPKPSGKPTYRLVTQMTGKHGYRRVDAGKAMARGLEGKLPASWKFVDENAALEIWLTIQGRTAVCGIRLSDKTMRHRTYKQEHMPASLRPSMAAALVRLADLQPEQRMIDPMCGAGTILAEQFAVSRKKDKVDIFGGDVEMEALRNTRANLKHYPDARLLCWDAQQLPLAGNSADRIVSNPPFGKQIGKQEDIGAFYKHLVREFNRILKIDGKAILLVSDFLALRQAAGVFHWRMLRKYNVRVLGQQAVISMWKKIK